MAAYATIIAYTGLLNITDDIKKFIIEHQTCIGGDIIDGILFLWSLKELSSEGVTLASGIFSIASLLLAEGDLIV
ncbi:MAG: hypothetical protein H5T38_00935, partial [Methanobacteriaceae archaeon]|nr:hypothetical protein [Methanobacteriaceae archaeon]